MSCDATPAPAVSVKGLGKRYRLYERPEDRLKEHLRWRGNRRVAREFWALRDVTFEIAPGERFGVIGRNGSGKSTLLQLIAGTLQPTEGSVSVRGRVAALLELGSGFNPQFTGRENVLMNGVLLGLSPAEIDARFDAIAAFADIGAFIEQPVHTYSSGMLMRLAFAVAAAVDADVLLVDEALAVGDVFFRQKCYRRLDELRQRGTSIVLVSHAMTEIEQFCQRAILLDRGAAVLLAPAAESVKRYYLIEQESRGRPLTVNGSGPAGEPQTRATADTPLDDDAGPPWPVPPAQASFDLSTVAHVSNGWAHCLRVAICDPSGRACRAFEQGDTAVFDVEYDLLQPIDVPNAGLEIVSDKGTVVHGKNTIEYGTAVPRFLPAGTRLRIRQDVVLSLAPGEYTITVGLACLSAADYDRRGTLDWQEAEACLVRLCHLPNVGAFAVVPRRSGSPVRWLHHGIADLPGRAEVQVRRAQARTIATTEA